MRRLPVESLGPGATSPVQRHRRRGQVVRQRTANPLSPVRIRAAPLRCPFCVLGPSDPPAHPLRSPARMRTAGSSRGDRFRYRASARSVPRAPTRPRIALTGRPEAHPGGASILIPPSTTSPAEDLNPPRPLFLMVGPTLAPDVPGEGQKLWNIPSTQSHEFGGEASLPRSPSEFFLSKGVAND